MIKWFIYFYQVDLHEACYENPCDYPCFNAFFTRYLKPSARILPNDLKQLISPVDGTLSQFGMIQEGVLLQAKGVAYRLQALLADTQETVARFQGGQYATFYLAPKDYHRVHLPWPGRLTEMVYVPGRLFSVNEASALHVPDLFTRNERLICYYDTKQGPMAIILVAAMIVAGIEVPWHGVVAPNKQNTVQRWRYDDIHHQRGEEIGHFKCGSTVIVLCPKNFAKWDEALSVGKTVRMGQGMATVQISEVEEYV